MAEDAALTRIEKLALRFGEFANKDPRGKWLQNRFLRGVSYVWVRASLANRMLVEGLEDMMALTPDTGVMLVSNHRSFIDPFILGLCNRRPVYYVAKEELFKFKPLGWFLSSLGAFPVRRGAADADMIETAKAILKRGDPVLIFPEGTRVRPGALGQPHRGVGRLVLETGATVVPVAMIGTEAIRKGLRIRPHKIRVRIGAPRSPSSAVPMPGSPPPSIPSCSARGWRGRARPPAGPAC